MASESRIVLLPTTSSTASTPLGWVSRRRHAAARDYYVIEGARSWTVSDQLMKKEIILQGMGWGHMPAFLVEQELRDGRLTSLAGRFLAGGNVELVAARRRNHPHGPVAQRLWRYIAEQASGPG